MIFRENGSVLLFYCQCHDFKVGQASKSRNWLVDGCWRATRIMTKMRWKSQLGFRSQCGNFRNLHTFIFSQKFREIIAFSTRLHCMAFSWIIFLWKWNSIISTLCSLLLIKLKTKTFHLYLDSWTLGDKIGVFNEKFNLKATLEIRSFYFQTFSEIIYVLLKLYIFAKIFLHSTTIPTYITNNNRLAADVSSIPKDKWFVVGKSFLKIN